MEKNSSIPFTKMQGAGNDFVVIDNRKLKLSVDEIAELAPAICNRKYGVGSDGILALSNPQQSGVDYTMVYRNPDGSDAGMCGNGGRCIALFAHTLGFNKKHQFDVHGKVYQAVVEPPNTVSLSFPMNVKVQKDTVGDESVYKAYTGTEHIVIPVPQSSLENEAKLRKQGSTLRQHPKFQPKGTNVNFIYGLHETGLELQTFERGVEDLTLACGTGAIASALAWHHIQKADSSEKYSVKTKGGTLFIHFSFDSSSDTYTNLKLEGPAHFVFEGTFLQ